MDAWMNRTETVWLQPHYIGWKHKKEADHSNLLSRSHKILSYLIGPRSFSWNKNRQSFPTQSAATTAATTLPSSPPPFHQSTTTTFHFRLTIYLFTVTVLRGRLSSMKNLLVELQRVSSTGRIPFQSPNQQCQCTKGTFSIPAIYPTLLLSIYSN